jgi:hypothetical protein
MVLQENKLFFTESERGLDQQNKLQCFCRWARGAFFTTDDRQRCFYLFKKTTVGLAMLTGARPFSGPSLPFCLPVIATRSIVLSIGAESSG